MSNLSREIQHVGMVRTTNAGKAGGEENRNKEGLIQCSVVMEIGSQ